MKHAPRVSVIIPTYYSHETVASCLEALRAQTFHDFEIILVNSSPEEQTQQIVTSRFPGVLFSQSPSRLLPHAARNYGVCLASGELFVFTDPDCRAHPDWLACLVAAYDAGHCVVVGSMGLVSHRWLEQGIHLCKFSSLLPGLPAGFRWIAPTANVCYARALWEKVGSFNGDRFCGDALLSWRASASGYTPWFEPHAVVEHRHADTITSLWCQRISRGKEFAETRTEFEQWSRLRAVLHLLGLPALIMLVLIRTGRDAIKSGWGVRSFLTLPVQIVGQTAWCLGETLAYAKRAVSGCIGTLQGKRSREIVH